MNFYFFTMNFYFDKKWYCENIIEKMKCRSYITVAVFYHQLILLKELLKSNMYFVNKWYCENIVILLVV